MHVPKFLIFLFHAAHTSPLTLFPRPSFPHAILRAAIRTEERLHNNAARNSHSNVDYDISSSAQLYTTGHLHTLKEPLLFQGFLSRKTISTQRTPPPPYQRSSLLYIGGKFYFHPATGGAAHADGAVTCVCDSWRSPPEAHYFFFAP